LGGNTLRIASGGNIGGRSVGNFAIDSFPSVGALASEGGEAGGVESRGRNANALVTSTRAARSSANGDSAGVGSGKVSLSADSALSEAILAVLGVTTAFELASRSGRSRVGNRNSSNDANGVGIIEGFATTLSAINKTRIVVSRSSAVFSDGGGRLFAGRAGLSSGIIGKTRPAAASVTNSSANTYSLARSIIAFFTTAFLVNGDATSSFLEIALFASTALYVESIEGVRGGDSVGVAGSAVLAGIADKIGRAVAFADDGGGGGVGGTLSSVLAFDLVAGVGWADAVL